MNTTAPPSTELHLARRAVHRIEDPAGLEIVCREGTVWLTLDHDPRDIVLEAGDRFATQEHRHAVLYALAPARLEVGPADRASGPAQVDRWFAPRPAGSRLAGSAA